MAKKQFQWVRDSDEDAGDETLGSPQRLSKSARKRQADKLDGLVRKMLALQPSKWLAMPLSDEVRSALTEGRRLQNKSGVRGGLRRQVLHIAGLLRGESEEALSAMSAAAEDLGGPGERELALMQVERWRSRILKEHDRAIHDLLQAHPQADRQRLRQLAMAAQREQQQGLAPRAFRQLFAYLREVVGV